MTYLWTERAACLGMEVNLFFSEDKVDQLYAQSFCQSCPVRQDCEDSGDANDFRDGVRAGHLPGTFKGAPRRVSLFPNEINRQKVDPVTGEEIIRAASKAAREKDWSYKLGTVCSGGHVFEVETLDPYGRCKVCNRIRNASRYKKKDSTGKINA